MESEKTRSEVEENRSSFRFRDALERMAAVVAIVPVLSALLYYLGVTAVSSTYLYFGVYYGMLNFSTAEYVLQGTAVMLLPLGGLLILLLLFVRLHPRIESWAEALPIPMIVSIMGALLLALSLFRYAQYHRGSAIPTTAALGILLVAYASYLRRQIAIRRGEPDPWVGASAWPTRAFAILAILVGIYFVFAASGIYAQQIGINRAKNIAVTLPFRPAVFVYSSERLMLDLPGVLETKTSLSAASEQYRYSGLRLLIWADGKYFLLPDGWTYRDGTVIILPESDSLRIEVSNQPSIGG